MHPRVWPPTVGLNSTKRAAYVAGLTSRQVDYWYRTGAVRPTMLPNGSGTRIRWSDEDVARLSVIAPIAHLFGSSMTTELVAAVWSCLSTPPESWPPRLHAWRHRGKWQVTTGQPPPMFARVVFDVQMPVLT